MISFLKGHGDSRYIPTERTPKPVLRSRAEEDAPAGAEEAPEAPEPAEAPEPEAAAEDDAAEAWRVRSTWIWVWACQNLSFLLFLSVDFAYSFVFFSGGQSGGFHPSEWIWRVWRAR